MKKKLVYYEGLYKDSHNKNNLSRNTIFLELIETRSKGFNWNIKPHLHAHLYQVFYIISGEVNFSSVEKTRSLKTPFALVIPPNTIHGLEYSEDVKGYILSLSDTVFDNLFPATTLLPLEFGTLKYIPLQQQEFEKINSIINEMNEELFKDKAYKKLMLNNLVQQLFINLHRFEQLSITFKHENSGTNLDYYRRFLQLIKVADKQKSIPAYAKEMGITSVHLNRICNQIAGKSALLIVQEYLIDRSKNYLSHTNYNIAEIAIILNFEYPNYFARLFKKLNGVSPKEFRNQL